MFSFQYDVRMPGGRVVRMRNLLPYEGQEALLRKIFAEDGALYDSGVARSTLYIGLCDQIPTRTLELAGITTEPGIRGGYERKSWTIGSAATGNTFENRNNFAYVQGEIFTFEADGADYSRAVRRFFMTTSSAPGAEGVLLSVSGPLPTEVTLLDGADGLSVRPSLGFFN